MVRSFCSEKEGLRFCGFHSVCLDGLSGWICSTAPLCVFFSPNIMCSSVWSSSEHLRVYLKVCKSCDTVSLCRHVGPLTDSRACLRGRTNTLCFQWGPASSAAPLHSVFIWTTEVHSNLITIQWFTQQNATGLCVCDRKASFVTQRQSGLTLLFPPSASFSCCGITNTDTLVTGVSSLTCHHRRSRADVLF